MFPFYFSGVNSSMLSQNPADSINLSWNMWNARNAANSIMYMTPSFNAAIFDFPEVMTFGNNLLNPALAIQQTLNSFNNGTWMNGVNGGSWFNNMFKSPWADNNTTPGGGTTDAEKAENNLKQKQYDKLKAVLKSYKENSKTLTDEQEAKLETALNKGGKIEEKLDALKAVYKELDFKELRKALLALDENKKALNEMGYNFNDAKYSFKNLEADEGITHDITKIRDEIAEKKYDVLQNYATKSDSNEGILKLISYWNDEYNDADGKDNNDNRSIIRHIATNLPTDNAAKKNAKETVGSLVNALVNKAKDVSARIGDCDKLDKARTELENLSTTTKNRFDKSNLNKLAEKFEEVYARIRIAEAEELSAKIRKDYAFLNDISESDTDFVNTNLVVEDVKADLEAEDVTIPKDLDNINDGDNDGDDTKNVQQQVKKLYDNGDLRDTACNEPEVYYSDKNKKHYMIKDGEFVELKNVSEIKEDGSCVLTDGTSKKLEEVETSKVDPATLKTDGKSGKESKDETVEETLSGQNATGMRGIANENGMTSTGITGYYQKGKHYYKYNEETQEMELLSGVTKVNNDGTVVKNGQTIAVREVESPEVSGKILRQKLAGNTEERDYTIVRKKLNSFSLYDAPEEIVKFLKAYDDERSWLAQYNSRITAQIVTENGINDADKENYIKMIAEKVLLVAEKANIGQDDDIMQDLQEIANGTHEVKFWSSDFCQWNSNKTIAVAKKLDKLIDQVIDKYDELSAEDKAADTDETES